MSNRAQEIIKAFYPEKRVKKTNVKKNGKNRMQANPNTWMIRTPQ